MFSTCFLCLFYIEVKKKVFLYIHFMLKKKRGREGRGGGREEREGKRKAGGKGSETARPRPSEWG